MDTGSGMGDGVIKVDKCDILEWSIVGNSVHFCVDDCMNARCNMKVAGFWRTLREFVGRYWGNWGFPVQWHSILIYLKGMNLVQMGWSCSIQLPFPAVKWDS